MKAILSTLVASLATSGFFAGLLFGGIMLQKGIETMDTALNGNFDTVLLLLLVAACLLIVIPMIFTRRSQRKQKYLQMNRDHAILLGNC